MKARLDFTPPMEPDMAKLHILEAVASDGPFNEIDEVTAIGVYPDYISYYTTNNATAVDRWFAIQWETAAGVLGDISAAVQGGTITYVAEVVNRVMLRMPDADENIITQEASAVVEEILHVDPFDPVTANVKYKTWNGMALLTMARVQLSTYAAQSSTSNSFTAGLVSMKSDSSNKLDLKGIRDLMEEAGRLLGFSTARIVQMVVPEIAGGLSQIVMADISRLQIDVA
jgi:hypothetical protein